MKFIWIHRVFSYTLVVVYSLVIFQQGFIHGIHFLSHATEILSDGYSFHNHGNGSFHVHHHDIMEIAQAILQQNQNQLPDDEEKIPLQQQEFKLHVPAYSHVLMELFPDEIDLRRQLHRKPISILLDILTPPPKG